MNDFTEKLLLELSRATLEILNKTLGKNSEIVICKYCNEDAFKIIHAKNNSEDHNVGFFYNGLQEVVLRSNGKGVYEKLKYVNDKYIKTYTTPIFNGDEMLGVIVVNQDVTDLVYVQKQFQEATGYEIAAGEEHLKDIGAMTDYLLEQAVLEIGKPVSAMKKADKKKVIHSLDNREYFQIKKSVEKVASYLEISRYTLYTYLEDVRSLEYNDSKNNFESNQGGEKE